jgi:hypothetical protein
MKTDREVMQQALDVLQKLSEESGCNIDQFTFGRWGGDVAIKTLREALAQPEREIEITFLDWVDPIFGVMPVNTDGKKPLILRAKLKGKNI